MAVPQPVLAFRAQHTPSGARKSRLVVAAENLVRDDADFAITSSGARGMRDGSLSSGGEMPDLFPDRIQIREFRFPDPPRKFPVTIPKESDKKRSDHPPFPAWRGTEIASKRENSRYLP
jgi:hypothetical protein